MCEEKEGEGGQRGGDPATDGRSEETGIGVCVLLRKRRTMATQ